MRLPPATHRRIVRSFTAMFVRPTLIIGRRKDLRPQERRTTFTATAPDMPIAPFDAEIVYQDTFGRCDPGKLLVKQQTSVSGVACGKDGDVADDSIFCDWKHQTTAYEQNADSPEPLAAFSCPPIHVPLRLVAFC
jgi:hypothetical protein